jgi:hypothetical protein
MPRHERDIKDVVISAVPLADFAQIIFDVQQFVTVDCNRSVMNISIFTPPLGPDVSQLCK